MSAIKPKRTKKQKGTQSSTLPSPPLPTPLNAATRDEVSQLAMIASITRGAFEDVKFYTFSRRTTTGNIDTPLPLFGNSTLIRKSSSHFDYVLMMGFGESGITDMDAPFPDARPRYTEEYDYYSDSDLEDELDGSDQYPAGEPDRATSSTLTDSTENKNGSILDRVQDDDTQETNDKGETKVTEQAAGKDTNVNVLGRKGRVVHIEDIAYRTLQAFIFYAYFEKLSFAPLKSQGEVKVKGGDLCGPPSCSPKSMYRLAEKYGIDSLKTQSAEDIKSKLTSHNIFCELFSSFTLRYPEIQKMEVDFLHEHLSEDSLRTQLPKWLQSLESGELGSGSAAIFSMLFQKVWTGKATTVKCPRGCNSPTTCNRCGYNATFRCSGCGNNLN